MFKPHLKGFEKTRQGLQKQTGFYNKSAFCCLLVFQDNIVQPIKRPDVNDLVHGLHPSDFRCGVPSTFRCSSPNSPTNSFSLAALIWTSSHGCWLKGWMKSGIILTPIQSKMAAKKWFHIHGPSQGKHQTNEQKSLPGAKYASWHQDGWNILHIIQGQYFFFMGN